MVAASKDLQLNFVVLINKPFVLQPARASSLSINQTEFEMMSRQCIMDHPADDESPYKFFSRMQFITSLISVFKMNYSYSLNITLILIRIICDSLRMKIILVIDLYY